MFYTFIGIRVDSNKRIDVYENSSYVYERCSNFGGVLNETHLHSCKQRDILTILLGLAFVWLCILSKC